MSADQHQVLKSSIKVALIGNPNSGKSTLFNILTGLHQKTGNFPGVTVEKKIGTAKVKRLAGDGPLTIDYIDLPGTYSLYPRSLDERITYDILCDPANDYYPDVVLVVADASNLKRSLLLATQIIDLKMPVLLVLNMMDLVEGQGGKINTNKLSELLKVKVIPINARTASGVEDVKKALGEIVQSSPVEFFDITTYTNGLGEKIKSLIKANSNYAAMQAAIHIDDITYFDKRPDTKNAIRSLIQEYKFDGKKFQAIESVQRYLKIETILKKCTVKSTNKKVSITDKLDKFLTHKVWGYMIFLFILFLLFQSVFFLASYPMSWIESLFIIITEYGKQHLPPGELSSLFTNGILAGISGIAVFIPQIALLFGFIGLLEDTGYMARVSFIMDKLMRKFGLNGRSVIPLVSGVACAVPAIMGTRTISNWKERIITIMVTPLMSCSARLPVYTLLISLVIPADRLWGFFNYQGLALMLLYLIGFIAAIGAAYIMKYIIKAREKSYFIMELPVYRSPRWQSIFLTMLDKVKIFLWDAGKIIVAISIVLWMLAAHAPGNAFEEIEKKYSGDLNSGKLTEIQVQERIASEKLESSYAGILGKAIEPAIRPMGFDWKIGIALVTSFAAREVFVGTMATIYSVGSEGETRTIRESMLADKDPVTGEKRYTLALGISLMVFYAFAMQCMSTLAVVFRETRSWKWPVIQFLYMGALAYLASFVVYQVLK